MSIWTQEFLTSYLDLLDGKTGDYTSKGDDFHLDILEIVLNLKFGGGGSREYKGRK